MRLATAGPARRCLVECEVAFVDDVLSGGVVGLTRIAMREYLQYVADKRLPAMTVLAAVEVVARRIKNPRLKVAGTQMRRKQARTWGDAETLLVDPKTGLRLGANDLRSPDSAAVGW